MHHKNAKFPVCPCYVCKRFLPCHEGTLRFDNFISYLEKYKLENPGSNLSENSPKANFVNALINAYLRQFPAIKLIQLQQPNGFDSERDIGQNQLNLEKILKAPLEKDVGIILHDRCLPRDVCTTGYPIDLRDIYSRKKAKEFYTLLHKKVWFNHEGWKKLTRDLFGKLPKKTPF